MRSLVIALGLGLLSGCALAPQPNRWIDPAKIELTQVASSDRQWTGLAVSPEGRLFVNYPLWSESQEFAVGELQPDGSVKPYPNQELNSWTPEKPAWLHFVCVQALLADELGRLWILDPANPRFEGVVKGGPKLMMVNLTSNTVIRTYRFTEEIVRPNSYLNDLRLDLEQGVAYLTDSGDGALIVLDLESGNARRLLDDHPSTEAEEITIVIEGEAWARDGQTPKVHADGIALSADKDQLYFQALTGTMLYRISTAALRDMSLSSDDLSEKVQRVGFVGPSDGLLCGPDGAVYLTSLEKNAIQRIWPHSGELEMVKSSPEISWPDSCAYGADGQLYFTTARIHQGAEPRAPYAIYRLDTR